MSMSRTLNALYDRRPEAEIARARLAAEADVRDIRILQKSSVAEFAELSLSAEDRQKYRDGLESGASLLSARLKGGEDAEKIVRILEEAAGFSSSGAASNPAQSPTAAMSSAGETLESERIPLVEEELRIGRREVVRGGARVHTSVREVPIESSITLQQERLHIEAQPANRPMSDADVEAGGLLKSRVIELSEMREVPVIAKSAFVREEIVVKKTVEERTEVIHETVKRTEVDIEDLNDRGSGEPGSAAAGTKLS